jgi:thymidine phosphorylase
MILPKVRDPRFVTIRRGGARHAAYAAGQAGAVARVAAHELGAAAYAIKAARAAAPEGLSKAAGDLSASGARSAPGGDPRART